MYPYCPGSVPNRAINPEQEKEAWMLSDSPDVSKTITSLMVAGLAFHSLLESIGTSAHQLAVMVAGLGTAYGALRDALYEGTPKDLVKTQWGNLDTFMACNAGFGGDEPREGFTSTHPTDVLPVPFLYSESAKICIVWTGAYQGKVFAPADVASYDSVGACFGWEALYKEESISAERMWDPNMLADMVAMLLEDLSHSNTSARRYASNIYSVRRCNIFTLSMRSSASVEPTNLHVNFKQETRGQKMSTFPDGPTQGSTSRSCFYSSLETVDITTEQLGDMIAGPEGAYDMLVNNVFKQSGSIISRTPFGTVGVFMQCIPRGILREQSDESSIHATPDTKAAIPVMLVSKNLRRVIVYDGQHRSMDELSADIDTYNPGSMCYGWDVCCKEDVNAKISFQGDDLGEMLDELLYALMCPNTNTKMSVKNLESTQ